MEHFTKTVKRVWVIVAGLISFSLASCYPEGWERTLFPGHTAGGWMNSRAFVALKSDGSIAVWGDPLYGGGVKSPSPDDLNNIREVYSTGLAFAALREDGTVVTWGNPKYGGDSSTVQSQLHNVKTIFSTERAFAALREDGTVVTWGNPKYGGDSSTV
ncbi:MAG: hypothetical protein C6I05_05915, partial [Epsilonproteobacteria bacterium]|nr:hypothetical protein [Campylobacterota bacterium]